MTSQEIKDIPELVDFMLDRCVIADSRAKVRKKLEEVCGMAIKALEQEPILDKIKAEIDQKQYDFMSDEDYDEGIRFGLMLAYQIINKYAAESEDKK